MYFWDEWLLHIGAFYWVHFRHFLKLGLRIWEVFRVCIWLGWYYKMTFLPPYPHKKTKETQKQRGVSFYALAIQPSRNSIEHTHIYILHTYLSKILSGILKTLLYQITLHCCCSKYSCLINSKIHFSFDILIQNLQLVPKNSTRLFGQQPDLQEFLFLLKQ